MSEASEEFENLLDGLRLQICLCQEVLLLENVNKEVPVLVCEPHLALVGGVNEDGNVVQAEERVGVLVLIHQLVDTLEEVVDDSWVAQVTTRFARDQH